MADDFTTGATSAAHSLRAYITRNPFKTFGNMTKDDYDNMFDLFVAENSEISATPSFEDAAGTAGAATSTLYAFPVYGRVLQLGAADKYAIIDLMLE
jgi:hypothetical protein